MTAAWETRGDVDGADRDAHDLARFGYGAAAKAPAALLAITPRIRPRTQADRGGQLVNNCGFPVRTLSQAEHWATVRRSPSAGEAGR